MTHPGVGPLRGLAFVLINGDAELSSVASRWRATSDWCRWNIPVGIGDRDTSPGARKAPDTADIIREAILQALTLVEPESC